MSRQTTAIGRPGADLHSTRRPGCLPAPSPSGMLTNARMFVRAETWPCQGHGVATKGGGGVARLGYLMTYWVVTMSGYRQGPYESRESAERAMPRLETAPAGRRGSAA